MGKGWQMGLFLLYLLASCSKSNDIQTLSKIAVIPLDEYLIYEDGKHNAFTDLCEYNGKYYCSFRNALHHIPKNKDEYGKIFIMESDDGVKWNYLFAVENDNYDLRDPKLVIDSFGYLNLYCGYSKLVGADLIFQGSKAGRLDLEDKKVDLLNICVNKWLWTVVWYENMAYSFAYDDNGVYFLKSENGYDWVEIIRYGKIICNEASLTFVNKRAQVFLRTASGRNSLIGYANFPYSEWTFTEIPQIIQSPKIIPFYDGCVLLAGRMIKETTNERVCGLFLLNNKALLDTIWISSSAIDIAYPGIVKKDKNIFLSFYSGDWSSSNIYVKKFFISYLE